MVRPEIELAPGEVHVWTSELHCDDLSIRQHKDLLSPEEFSRAERFLHQQHRDKYIVAHGLVRQILARYLDLTPAAIRYEYQEFGKPGLSPHLNLRNINFNLSHSGNRLLLGVVAQARIGVDIEEIRPESATLDVAARFFTPRENEELRTLSGPDQTAAFFACWTRKEACLKALGCGLSLEPQNIEVTLKPQDSPKLLKPFAGENPDHWTLFHLPYENYLAAIATDALGPWIKKSG